jgi:hypothetical protein
LDTWNQLVGGLPSCWRFRVDALDPLATRVVR